MQIEILHLKEGAKKARGLTVIIDVFRAFSMQCYMLLKGAEKIYAVRSLDTARKLKEENPDAILIGERKGEKPEDFNFGNSPTEIEHSDLSGRTIIHTTSAGTLGIALAQDAEDIITGSFVDAKAITEYIKKKDPENVSLVAMGEGAEKNAEEDDLCAEYIKASLEGKDTDFDAIKEKIRKSSTSERFFDQKKTHSPENDFYMCLALDKADFIIKAEKIDDEVFLMKRI